MLFLIPRSNFEEHKMTVTYERLHELSCFRCQDKTLNLVNLNENKNNLTITDIMN